MTTPAASTPAPTTPAAAPSAPVSVAPSAPAPTTKADRHAAAMSIVKEGASAAEPATTPATGSAPAAAPKPVEERAARQLAQISREHKRLLNAKEQHSADIQRERAELAAEKADLEIARAVKRGDFTALEALDPQWYDKASKQLVAKMKPDDPSVLRDRFNAEFAKVQAELEALKNPKPKEKTPEEVATAQKEADEGLVTFKTTVVDAVKADARFEALHSEDPVEVGEEIAAYVDRLWQSAGKPAQLSQEQINAWVEEASVKLEAAVRIQNDLQRNPGTGTNDTATTQPRSKSGSAKPQQITPRGTNTLTASMHGAVPVGGETLTRDDRRRAAKALVRAAGQG